MARPWADTSVRRAVETLLVLGQRWAAEQVQRVRCRRGHQRRGGHPTYFSLSSVGCPLHPCRMERWGSYSPSGRLPTSSLLTWYVECLPVPQYIVSWGMTIVVFESEIGNCESKTALFLRMYSGFVEVQACSHVRVWYV